MHVQPSDFTAAMRLFPAAVSIVTTGTEMARGGLTATAVMSLTAEPPQIAVAVNRGASAFPHIVANGCFCVNTLATSHEGIARGFAGGRKGDERFADGAWMMLSTGSPALSDAVMSLDCRGVQAIDFSSHSLLIGSVVAVRRNPDAVPLLFLNGRYFGAEVDRSAYASAVAR